MSTTLETQYAFHGAVEVHDQLDALETMLDPGTAECLRTLGIPAGARCWEVGAGGGSIARHLRALAGPGGHVVATDLDTSRIVAPGAEILQHDVRCDPAPPGGPFDVIHARWVLMHLPERRDVLSRLADALAPGGWLVIEESAVTSDGLPVLTSSVPADAELFGRFSGAVVGILADAGADPQWGAHGLHSAMAESSLEDVRTVHRTDSWTGGGPGSRLHSIHTRQLREPLGARGFTDGDLARVRHIASDPAFSALGYPLVSTCGRRAQRTAQR
ncbi:class I SAM-dependent methyltransferase [Streptomyces sp. NBC_01264]|uniref:class I SAM-dependent methyltransferase n=1 Tax=Streptomyces sp. NBC_01264 TaxID=2903804 RepID=UPI002258F55C|nr:class I SAM-dependent methyltransferase [Streptomyces sp. NBC_01264]MCX4781690.1 class I SAM-dependent methyltransferase [Streptomyces sp. NBC_01264]